VSSTSCTLFYFSVFNFKASSLYMVYGSKAALLWLRSTPFLSSYVISTGDIDPVRLIRCDEFNQTKNACLFVL
jgi:hypothetical protein